MIMSVPIQTDRAKSLEEHLKEAERAILETYRAFPERFADKNVDILIKLEGEKISPEKINDRDLNVDWKQIDAIKSDIRELLENSEYNFGEVITALDMLKVDLKIEAESSKNALTMQEIVKLRTISL